MIEPGDLFLLDFSVVVHGYRGDFTNTFVVGGDAHARPARAVRGLRRGPGGRRGRCSARACRPATSTRRSAAISPRCGLGDAFPSHTGHGLGLGHPEPPYFVPESDETLLAGDVVALEPGLYVPASAACGSSATT